MIDSKIKKFKLDAHEDSYVRGNSSRGTRRDDSPKYDDYHHHYYTHNYSSKNLHHRYNNNIPNNMTNNSNEKLFHPHHKYSNQASSHHLANAYLSRMRMINSPLTNQVMANLPNLASMPNQYSQLPFAGALGRPIGGAAGAPIHHHRMLAANQMAAGLHPAFNNVANVAAAAAGVIPSIAVIPMKSKLPHQLGRFPSFLNSFHSNRIWNSYF